MTGEQSVSDSDNQVLAFPAFPEKLQSLECCSFSRISKKTQGFPREYCANARGGSSEDSPG